MIEFKLQPKYSKAAEQANPLIQLISEALQKVQHGPIEKIDTTRQAIKYLRQMVTSEVLHSTNQQSSTDYATQKIIELKNSIEDAGQKLDLVSQVSLCLRGEQNPNNSVYKFAF